MYRKAKGRRSSSHERRNGLSIAALVISLVLISATVFLTTMTDESFGQGSTVSTNKTSTTAGNVTAQAVPQGTSLISSKNATSSNVSQGTVVATGGGRSNLNCQSIASTIGGIAVPNPNKVCDVLIPRQAPTIIGPGNMNMNKFSTINSIVEIASVSDLMTKQGGKAGVNATTTTTTASSSANPLKVFVMGEFSLLDPQLVTMVKAAV